MGLDYIKPLISSASHCLIQRLCTLLASPQTLLVVAPLWASTSKDSVFEGFARSQTATGAVRGSRDKRERGYLYKLMAEEGVVLGTDLPVKRPREEENMVENNGNGASMETDETKTKPQGLSAVIPGWFSEISPMWPGLSLFINPPYLFVFLLFWVCLFLSCLLGLFSLY